MLKLLKSITISSTHWKSTLIHKKSPLTKNQPLLQWNLKAAKKTKLHCKYFFFSNSTNVLSTYSAVFSRKRLKFIQTTFILENNCKSNNFFWVSSRAAPGELGSSLKLNLLISSFINSWSQLKNITSSVLAEFNIPSFSHVDVFQECTKLLINKYFKIYTT